MNAYKLERLAERVEKQAYLRHSRVHGEHHWRKVAWTGLELAQQTSGADPELVFLFALLHDCKRLNEWGDKDHGKRAADWAKQLNLGLDKRRMGTLQEALVWHDDGYVDTDPTIGCCWDADRLQLRRVGTEPDLKLLSTNAAIQYHEERADWAMDMKTPSWGRILGVLEELRQPQIEVLAA
jgi:uncharacterized protein